MSLLADALGSIVRFLLAGLAGYFVHKGIWTSDAAASYVNALAAAITLGGISLGWSLIQKYRSKILLFTALQAPAGSTVEQVKDRVAAGKGAAITTVLLAVGLGTLLVGTAACGGKVQPNVNPLTAQQAKVAKVLAIVQAAGAQVAAAQAVEITLFQAGDIPAATHAEIQQAFLSAATTVQTAVTTLQSASAAPDLNGVITSVGTGLQTIVTALSHASSSQAAKIAGWIQAAEAALTLALA